MAGQLGCRAGWAEFCRSYADGREQAEAQPPGFLPLGLAGEGKHLYAGGQLAVHRDDLAADLVLAAMILAWAEGAVKGQPSPLVGSGL